MRTPRFAWSLMFAAVMTAACGDSKSSFNPTAPSVVSRPSLNAGAGEVSSVAGNNGNGNGNGNNNGGGSANPPSNNPGSGGAPSNTSPGAPGQDKVEIEGLITAVNTDSIEVGGQTVLVNSDTVIRHGNRRFELSNLRRGDRVHVRASRLEGASLQALEIMLQNPGEGEADPPPPPAAQVSVTATDPNADEFGPDTGTFRLTRSGDASLLASQLVVTFTLTGTATNGADYNLPLTATFLPGAPTSDVVVTPVNDNQNDPQETVVLTLTGVAPYQLGSPVSATVTIAPFPTGNVSVVAVDALATERSATGVNTGTFRLTRAGDPRLQAAALTVTFTLGGTATNGSDYDSPPLQALFAPGAPTADVVITPTPDSATEGTETVVLTLTTVPAPYELGSPASASLNIADSIPVVTLNLTDSTASEAGNTGTFLLARTGDRSQPLTVTVTYTGTATNGADYHLPTTFTFDPNVAQLTVTVTAVDDGLAEPSESVTMTLLDGDAYDVSGTVTRTVNISGSVGS